MANEASNPWITKSGRHIYENPWISLTEFQVIHPGGKDGIYGLVHFKSKAVGIIPLDEDYNTWIVGQFRYTLKKYSWEIPEGGSKLNQDPLDGAKRELMEETGIQAKTWIPVMELNLSNSVSDEEGIIYVAKDLSFHTPEPDEDEDLQIRKLPFSELFDMALRGEIQDGMALNGIFKVQHLILQGKI